MRTLTNDLALLSEFSEAEIGKLQAITETRQYSPGEVILKQGLPADAVYVLLDGVVRVTAIMSEEDETVGQDEEVLVRLKPGEFFGELSFITGTPPSLSVIAEEPSQVVAMPQAKLHALIGVDAAICRKLLFAITRTLVARLRDTGRELVLTRYFIRGH